MKYMYKSIILLLLLLQGCATTPPKKAKVKSGCPDFVTPDPEMDERFIRFCEDMCPVIVLKLKGKLNYHVICADKEWIENNESI